MNNNKMTVSFEITDLNGSLYRAIMDNFLKNEPKGGIRVYAASHRCLHDQIEAIEDCVDNVDVEGTTDIRDLRYALDCVLKKGNKG